MELNQVIWVEARWLNFQHTKTEKADTFRLLKTLNTARGEKALDDSLLLRLFEKWWPDLELALAKLPQNSAAVRPRRSDRELLEDIWDLVSEQAKMQDYGPNEEDELEEVPRVDIMEALRRSLEQSKKKPPTRSPSKKNR